VKPQNLHNLADWVLLLRQFRQKHGGFAAKVDNFPLLIEKQRL